MKNCHPQSIWTMGWCPINACATRPINVATLDLVYLLFCHNTTRLANGCEQRNGKTHPPSRLQLFVSAMMTLWCVAADLDLACRQLFQMCFALACFHCFEYVLAITIHGKNSVTLKSLLITKSYVLAMTCSMIEYFVEIYFCPHLKEHRILSDIGLAMVVVGEIIRKSAIITGGRSFTHVIKTYHEEHHVLVNHGVFKYLRHPSYCGFLIWSVGTQVMLCNPISSIGFATVVWRFFEQRIQYEEFFLRQFFGLEYEEYARQTFSGIPFIK